MATVVHTNINVSKRSDGAIEVKVVPPVTRVPNNDGVTTAQLTWKVTGGTFVAANFFDWKTGGAPPTVGRISADALQSNEYTKNTGKKSVSWEYWFAVQVNGGGPTLIIDPEVENLPPGQP